MKTLIIGLLFLSSFASAQQYIECTSFICKNGWNIKKGDTITLAQGSDNGEYKFVYKKKKHLSSLVNQRVIVDRLVKTSNTVCLLAVHNDIVDNYTVNINDALSANEVTAPSDFKVHIVSDNKHYTASNGHTYSVGELIEIGMGSMPNGDFKWLQLGGWGAILSYDSEKGSDQMNIPKGYAGTKVMLKEIKYVKNKKRDWEKVYFIVGGGNITNYLIDVEGAIQDCEMLPCASSKQTNTSSLADELLKLKNLKDQGILTDEEFNTAKGKLLGR